MQVIIGFVLVAAAGAYWKKDNIKRLLAVNSLFSAGKIVQNFSHMDAMFFHTRLALPDAPISPLPKKPMAMPPLDPWLQERAVTGLVVLKDGHLVHESYHQGTKDTDLRISWSVAKSFLSALMGVVIEEGDIASIEDQVTKYVPSLKGSAYEGATIRNVLNMASGVHFDEDYLAFKSDINKMGRVLALGGSMDDFAASLTERDFPPGDTWQYVSIDTHVLGMIIRAATGRRVRELMVEKLLAPLGLEADPIYLTDGHGVAFVLGGLNMRTRDYARMGQLFLQKGKWNGVQVVPESWVAQSTVNSAPNRPADTGYGFQWWLPADGNEGEYFARGVYGQYIYVNPTHNVVIAVNSADRDFSEDGANLQNIAKFREITAHVSVG